jgi:hypothetical protein
MTPKSCRLFGQDHATEQILGANSRFSRTATDGALTICRGRGIDPKRRGYGMMRAHGRHSDRFSATAAQKMCLHEMVGPIRSPAN